MVGDAVKTLAVTECDVVAVRVALEAVTESDAVEVTDDVLEMDGDRVIDRETETLGLTVGVMDGRESVTDADGLPLAVFVPPVTVVDTDRDVVRVTDRDADWLGVLVAVLDFVTDDDEDLVNVMDVVRVASDVRLFAVSDSVCDSLGVSVPVTPSVSVVDRVGDRLLNDSVSVSVTVPVDDLVPSDLLRLSVSVTVTDPVLETVADGRSSVIVSVTVVDFVPLNVSDGDSKDLVFASVTLSVALGLVRVPEADW
jgi:hypothetical protein